MRTQDDFFHLSYLACITPDLWQKCVQLHDGSRDIVQLRTGLYVQLGFENIQIGEHQSNVVVPSITHAHEMGPSRSKIIAECLSMIAYGLATWTRGLNSCQSFPLAAWPMNAITPGQQNSKSLRSDFLKKG